MFSISIHAGSVMWMLVYKEKPVAQVLELRQFQDQQHFQQQVAGQKSITIADDFGQEATISAGSLHAILLEDADQTQEINIRRSIEQAITQGKAQQRARQDPTLKAMGSIQQTPMYSPMMNGRGN